MIMGASALRGLIQRRTTQRRRSSSWDRTGANRDFVVIPPGEAAVMADIEGAGCITHLWITINAKDPHYLRTTVLRMYWDGELHPSVEAPVGDFFGVGHARANHFISLPLNMVTGDGPLHHNQTAMNCFFPMPFAKGARLTLTNESSQPIESAYFYVDYEAGELPDDALRFHAHWRRELPTTATLDLATPGLEFMETFERTNLDGRENYVILDTRGYGHFVGVVLSIDHLNPIPKFGWFGEGDDMIFIDGETWPPTLHGTGTEDYFCAAWGYPSGKYDAPYHGVSLAGPTEGPTAYSGKWSMYRFHIEDPVIFHESIRVTIEHGHDNVHASDYSSVAYWYQNEPHPPFQPFPPAAARLPLDDRESLKRYAATI